MRKYIALLTALVLLCTLFGCNNNTEASYTTDDVITYQACLMAQTVGYSTLPSYLQGVVHDSDIVSMAQTFQLSSKDGPAEMLILTTDDADFAQTVIACNSSYSSSKHMACISALSYTTAMQLPTPLTATKAVLLRYGETCMYTVIFTPMGGNLASATIYPMRPGAANRLIQEHFAGAASYQIDEIQAAYYAGEAASVAAQPTGATADKNYYAGLVSGLLNGLDNITEASIEPYISDPDTATLTLNMANALRQAPSDTHVYRFPASTNQQLAALLGEDLVKENLTDLTKQRVYLGYPATLAAGFGTACLNANATLAGLMQPQEPGVAAAADEGPVLVTMALNENFSLLVALYPNENGIYQYRFYCLPCNYSRLTGLLGNVQPL